MRPNDLRERLTQSAPEAFLHPGVALTLHATRARQLHGREAVGQWWRERSPLLVDPLPRPQGLAATLCWANEPALVAGELQITLEPPGALVRHIDVWLLPRPVAPVERTSVRALLVTPSRRLLLLAMHDSRTDHRWWIAPGGGIEPGETEAQALRRELAEEVGFLPATLGPCVWTRTHTFALAERAVRQHERYLFAPVPIEHAVVSAAPDAGAVGHRWWTTQQLAQSDEPFAPTRLPDLLETLLEHGPPGSPVDIGL